MTTIGLEQGTDSAYSNARIQSLPNDSSSMAKKEEEKPQQSPSSSSVRVPTETIVSNDTATFDPNSEEQRISELRTPDLQDRIKSSNPVVRLRAFTELLEDGSSESIEQAKEIYENCGRPPAF